jgi:hypothetical protein
MAGLTGSFVPAPGVLTNVRLRQLLGARLRFRGKNDRLTLHGLTANPRLPRDSCCPDWTEPSLTFTAVVRGLEVPVVFRTGPGSVQDVHRLPAVGDPATARRVTEFSRACDLGSVGHYASDGVLELSVFKVRGAIPDYDTALGMDGGRAWPCSPLPW